MSVHPESLICLSQASKLFATEEIETRALANVDLRIERGDYVAISGPSGCGKSTLLSILGLLDTPTSGSYYLDGQQVSTLSATQRARLRRVKIGFIFQSFNLIGGMSVRENVELPLTYQRVPAKDRRQRVDEALEKVGMSHRANHRPNQLSGGQQQRVSVARAVVADPAILLADEPTGNLDSTNGDQVMQLLNQLHRSGATICMVTHDPRYAGYADRTVNMYDGSIVDQEDENHASGRDFSPSHSRSGPQEARL